MPSESSTEHGKKLQNTTRTAPTSARRYDGGTHAATGMWFLQLVSDDKVPSDKEANPKQLPARRNSEINGSKQRFFILQIVHFFVWGPMGVVTHMFSSMILHLAGRGRKLASE